MSGDEESQRGKPSSIKPWRAMNSGEPLPRYRGFFVSLLNPLPAKDFTKSKMASFKVALA
jgi:hypothetical protein